MQQRKKLTGRWYSAFNQIHCRRVEGSSDSEHDTRSFTTYPLVLKKNAQIWTETATSSNRSCAGFRMTLLSRGIHSPASFSRMTNIDSILYCPNTNSRMSSVNFNWYRTEMRNPTHEYIFLEYIHWHVCKWIIGNEFSVFKSCKLHERRPATRVQGTEETVHSCNTCFSMPIEFLSRQIV